MKKFFRAFLVPVIGWSAGCAIIFSLLFAVSTNPDDKSRGEKEREGCEDYCRDVGGFLVEMRADLYSAENAVCVCVIDTDEEE